MSNKPTTEQQAIIDFLPSRDWLAVNACAGSGKTTTLTMLAKSTDRTGLYLAFNKAMADESAQKFPSNIRCSTTHSLAFREVQVFKYYKDKLNRPKGFSRVNRGFFNKELIELFELPEICGLTQSSIAAMIKQSVTRFEQSADSEITAKHVYIPASSKNLMIAALIDDNKTLADEKNADKLQQQVKFYENKARELILNCARSLWDFRVDTQSPVLITHDSYLKMYQLRKPKVGYDLIFLDEAQDTNACTLDILTNENNKNSQLILVGDRRQSIYQWRGAVNAMKEVDCQTLELTQSFRYGQEVADAATAIIDGEMIIKGNPALDTRIVPSIESEDFTQLFRTNAALIDAALPYLASRKPIQLIMDVIPFARKIESVYALYRGDIDNVKDESVKIFSDYKMLVDESKDDPDLSMIVRRIKEDADSIPAIYQALYNYKKPANGKGAIFSSAHKSKGLEWQNVILASDFRSAKHEGEYVGLTEEEANLLYVAATRGQSRLVLNETAIDVIGHYQPEAETC